MLVVPIPKMKIRGARVVQSFDTFAGYSNLTSFFTKWEFLILEFQDSHFIEDKKLR